MIHNKNLIVPLPSLNPQFYIFLLFKFLCNAFITSNVLLVFSLSCTEQKYSLWYSNETWILPYIRQCKDILLNIYGKLRMIHKVVIRSKI